MLRVYIFLLLALSNKAFAQNNIDTISNLNEKTKLMSDSSEPTGLNSKAESEEVLKHLLDKKWNIKIYEIEGHKVPAETAEKDDYTIFYEDHSVKSFNRGTVTLSKWKFDSAKNVITLYVDENNEKTEMKIYDISETEFVWQTTNSEGMTMIIHMVSSVKD